MINKKDELSNECWQQIKLHFPLSTTNYPNLEFKLHLFHPYCLVDLFYFYHVFSFTPLLLPYMPLIHMDIWQ